MYDIYLGTMLCPIAPEKIQLKINSKNKNLTLINEGEVNILKKTGLTEVIFDLLLPNVKYPFAVYKSGFKSANYFLKILEHLKTSQNPFKFKVIRKFPNGKMLFNTNMKVSLETFSISDDVNEGFDVVVNIKLKQYKDFGTKTCDIKFTETKPKIVPPKPPRQQEKAPKPSEGKNKTYIVKKGDCLWKIAKKFYGNGALYTKIYNANREKIRNPNLIYPGQVFIIPG